jgi:hypothetical protein
VGEGEPLLVIAPSSSLPGGERFDHFALGSEEVDREPLRLALVGVIAWMLVPGLLASAFAPSLSPPSPLHADAKGMAGQRLGPRERYLPAQRQTPLAPRPTQPPPRPLAGHLP